MSRGNHQFQTLFKQANTLSIELTQIFSVRLEIPKEAPFGFER